MDNDSRINEANNCIQKAKEFLKTSPWTLKFKPNFDSAAYEYERAAICFKNAGRLDLCAESYVNAAKCHSSNNNNFHDAKAKESAAIAYKEIRQPEKALELFEESCELYFLSGNIETAIMAIDKAAKSMEKQDTRGAIKLYEKGITMAEGSQKHKNNFLQRIVTLSLRGENYDDAINYSNKLLQYYIEEGNKMCGQVVLGIVLMHLLCGDSAGALHFTSSILGESDARFSEEVTAGKLLIGAFNKHDLTSLNDQLATSIWKSLDHEYVRCARKLMEIESARKQRNDDGEVIEEDEEDLR